MDNGSAPMNDRVELDTPSVLGALRYVYDGCCEERQISIVDMGLVERVLVDAERIRVELVLTTGWCPFGSRMITAARDALEPLAGAREVEIVVDWDVAWEPARLEPALARSLHLLPVPEGPASRPRLLASINAKPTT